MTPVRVLAAVLAAIVSVVEPLPVPLLGDTVTQEAPELAVQAQPVVVVMVTVCALALLLGPALVGETA